MPLPGADEDERVKPQLLTLAIAVPGERGERGRARARSESEGNDVREGTSASEQLAEKRAVPGLRASRSEAPCYVDTVERPRNVLGTRMASGLLLA